MTDNAASDDRVPNEISFAATNLVKPDLTSSRRKSDTPPVKEGPVSGGLRAERQVFPPTPPPENEFAPSKPMRSNTVAGGPSSSSRSLSIRGAASRTRSRDEGRDDRDRDRVAEDSERYPPRRPTVRAPEPRRAQSTRTPATAAAPVSTAQRSRTVRERGHERSDSQRRRPNDYSEEAGDNPYIDEIYDSYAGEPPRRGGGSIRRGLTRRGTNRVGADRFVDDDDYASDAYEGSSFDDEDEFEMLDARSVRSGSSRRPPEVKKVCPTPDLKGYQLTPKYRSKSRPIMAQMTHA